MQIYLIYDNLTQDDALATIRKIYFHSKKNPTCRMTGGIGCFYRYVVILHLRGMAAWHITGESLITCPPSVP